MNKFTLIFAACVLLSGCATIKEHFEQLTPEQQQHWRTAGWFVGGVFIGAALNNDNDDVTFVGPPVHHDHCDGPPGQCRDD